MIHMLVSAPISFCVGCKCPFFNQIFIIFYIQMSDIIGMPIMVSSFAQTDGDYNRKIPTIHMLLLDSTYVYISWILTFSI
jgi:hypothetical protein